VTDFFPGQVWSYATRPGEEGSRVVICHVEQVPNVGIVVHIRIEGIWVQTPHALDGVTTVISHMPFEEGALRQHLHRVEAMLESIPEFQEGYYTWRRAFDQGQAGVFTISPAEAVGVMEQSLAY